MRAPTCTWPPRLPGPSYCSSSSRKCMAPPEALLQQERHERHLSTRYCPHRRLRLPLRRLRASLALKRLHRGLGLCLQG